MLSSTTLSTLVLLVAGVVNARQDPPGGGNLAACHGQQCDDCGKTAGINAGFPTCLVYPSQDNLAGFEAEGGNGYDVWWNSGDPNPGCKIIVRTPASTDLPACGYFLRSWDVGGCYYTSIQESFMLQYCCGDGDCEAASPGTSSKRSIDEVHALHLRGISSSTNFVLSNFNASTEEGTMDLGPVGEIKYRRTPLAASQQVKEVARNEAAVQANAEAREKTLAVIKQNEKRCDDSFALKETYTNGGQQTKVSPTQLCNSSGGCSVEISSSVTTGYSVSFTAGINIEVIEASVSTTFSKEKTSTITNTFMQDQGTTGYVTFIPTLKCYKGTYSSCDDGDLDGDACNPVYIGEGDSQTPDGTYSFVYA